MQVESIVVTKCQQLLLKAIHFGASDIHMMPTVTHYDVHFKKYGQLIFAQQWPLELANRIVTYFKFVSALDISERRKPQSGAFFEQLEGNPYAFRVSTLPAMHNKESVVVRIFLQHTAIPLEQLCIQPHQAHALKRLAEKGQGLLLFTGATGSGKTTSLYSLLHHCSHELRRHVISLEDPVERTQQQILQIQVNERAGITYSVGLRAILRHSPDVIMIGEIRDAETAHIAVEAALSGHLVLSSIHAKNTVNCIFRLLDLGISLEKLRQTIIGIVAQALVLLPQSDERRAMMELLCEPYLQQAFTAITANENYVLPEREQLQWQLAQWKEQTYATNR